MKPEELSGAIIEAFAEAHMAIAGTDSQVEREAALLQCYGRHAEICAAAFVDDVVANECIEYAEDIAILAQKYAETIIEISARATALRGWTSSDFRDATKRCVAERFFKRMNELLLFAIKTPVGSA